MDLLRPGLAGFEHAFAEVNGVRLHYVTGGAGPLVVLLPGYPQTWWQYHRVMPALARDHRVAAVDLRGMGSSDRPDDGYDKGTMAADIRALIDHLGGGPATVAGEDIGGMVAYRLAADHPEVVGRLVLAEAVHPDEGFREIRMLPMRAGDPVPWWIAFAQATEISEALLAGRFRVFLDWLLAQHGASPMDERSRAIYAAAYEQPGAVRAAHAWYRAWVTDIDDFAALAVPAMPVTWIGGASFPVLAGVVQRHVPHARLVEVEGAGHFLAEERPDVLLQELIRTEH